VGPKAGVVSLERLATTAQLDGRGREVGSFRRFERSPQLLALGVPLKFSTQLVCPFVGVRRQITAWKGPRGRAKLRQIASWPQLAAVGRICRDVSCLVVAPDDISRAGSSSPWGQVLACHIYQALAPQPLDFSSWHDDLGQMPAGIPEGSAGVDTALAGTGLRRRSGLEWVRLSLGGSVIPAANNGVTLSNTVFDALPFAAFVVDDDMRVLASNSAAARLLQSDPSRALRQRGGEALHCVNSAAGCGKSEPCADCILRTSVYFALKGGEPVRRRARLELTVGDHVEEMHALITAAPMVYEGTARVLLYIENLTLLFALTDVLPLCMGCKKVRDNDLWLQIESYLDSHLDVKFSHGLCPECAQRIYPEM
jgi:PAS domain-containing protein